MIYGYSVGVRCMRLIQSRCVYGMGAPGVCQATLLGTNYNYNYGVLTFELALGGVAQLFSGPPLASTTVTSNTR